MKRFDLTEYMFDEFTIHRESRGNFDTIDQVREYQQANPPKQGWKYLIYDNEQEAYIDADITPLKNCSPEERYRRALLIIDGLCLMQLDDQDNPMQPLINRIYRVAHVAHNFCSNGHPEWVNEIDRLTVELAQARIVDCEAKIRAQ